MSNARQRWAERLARYHASGQTVTAFCAAEGVSAPSFYSWKRKLAETTRPTTLVPIQLTASPAAAIELVLISGTILRLPPSYSPHDLATLLATLEARSC
jgi:transposase